MMVPDSAMERKSAAAAAPPARNNAMSAKTFTLVRDFDFRPLALRFLCEALLVERIEIDRRQQHRRETRARDEVGNRFARIRKENVRAHNAEDRPEIGLGHIANRK